MCIDPWIIRNERCDPATLAQFNSVCTVSNGYLGLKGNLAERRGEPWPVTLIHGVFDELDMLSLIRPSRHERPWLDAAHFDAPGQRPAVANLPDPLSVRVFVGGREVSLERGTVARFHQTLDLRDGVYRYGFDYRDPAGRTTRIEAARFAVLTHAHRAYVRYTVVPLDHDAPVCIWSGIDGTVRSNLTREQQFAVVETAAEPDGTCRLWARTRARGIAVELAVAHACPGPVGPARRRGLAAHEAAYVVHEFPGAVRKPVTLDRFIVLASSEDVRHGGRVDVAAELAAAARLGFERAVEQQRAAWAALWERADVQIDGDAAAQRDLRFCLFHLLAAAPRFADRLSVPVKLLTGEYYQGATFYDTDLYIVPFYTFVQPELARTCLNFRCHGLEAGRRIARELGCAGAKLAWQAGPDGEECLGPWYRFVRTNVHINGDVAWALWQYVRVSGDQAFLADRGVDLLVESARFYTSRATYDAGRDAYDLHHVAGPDEAHCQSTNNFYTNVLVADTLRRAGEALAELERADPPAHAEAVRRLGVRRDEPARWRQVADRLTLLFDAATKRYEQCAGFFELPPAPADLLARRREWFVPLWRYQALNQPDVLMALALLRDEFPEDVRRANWRYYAPKSMNFSSMSHAINAIVAADLGELDQAYEQFRVTAGLDLDESLTGRNDTHAGLHGTALGGAWLAVVRGFAGVRLAEDGLRIDPRLPPAWRGLRFSLMLRGKRVGVEVTAREIVLETLEAPPRGLPLRVAGRGVHLRSGQRFAFRYQA